MVWDGHSASMEKVSQKARENISIEEQIKVIHQTKGLVEDEAKSRIGPSITRAGLVPSTSAPQQAPAPPPLQPPPASTSISSLMPRINPVPPAVAPAVSKPTPSAVPPPQQAIIRMPQGVPAPQPMMMAPPSMMMVQPRPPQPILPPRPTSLLGMSLGPAVPAPMGVVPQLFRPVMPQAAVPAIPRKPLTIEEEPPSKKAKTEDTLIPEDHWLAQRPGPVSVLVQVPSMPDKSEWNLNGQTLQFMFGPQELCSAIKTKIAEKLNMPAGKQKLQYDGLFIKDNNSLAFYNFMPESVVQLSTKERGGRKK